MGPYNPDCMTIDELLRAEYALRDLASYCRAKAIAMVRRQDGKIAEALSVEAECNRIYETLPPELRW